jgi:TP901 family phage tail tape measure protein
MATKPIQSTDIASKDVFAPLIADTKELIALYEVLDQNTSKAAKNVQQLARGLKANNAGDLQKAVAAEKEMTAAIIEQEKRERAKIQTKKTLIGLEKMQAAAVAKEIKEQEQLTNVYKRESKQLNDLRNSYKNLAAQNKANTKEAKDLLTQITKLDTKLKGIDKTVGQSQRYVGAYERGLNNLKGTMGNLMNQASKLGIVLGGGMIIRDGFNTLVEYDEKLADIAKTTGLTVEQADELSKSLLNIDTRTSISNLQELAVAAGRLGITGKENLLSFAESADKVFVALGDDLSGTADEIATNLGKIADVFGASDAFGLSTSIEMTGSALNELSANSKANAGDILDFTNRLAGIGSQAGLTIPQVQALGALFSDTGQSVEVAATTLNVLLPKLADNQKKYAEVAGLTAEEFGKLLQNNPLEALTAVAKGAKNSEGGLIGLNETLKEFGVDSARAASIVGILAGETDKLNEFVTLGNEAYEKNTSLQDEFNIKNETTGALLEKLGKEWDKQVLGIGATTTASNSLKSVLGFLIDNLGTIVNLVLKGSIAWGSYKATILGLNIAEKASIAITNLRTQGLKALFIQQKATDTAAAASTKTFKIFNATVKANPIGLIVAGITAAILLFNELSTALTGTERGYKALNDARVESQRTVANERVELDKLLIVAKDETISKEKREAAITAINKISPEYLGNITLENVNTQAATKSVNAYVEALEKKAYQQAINNKLTDAYSRLIDAETSEIADNSGIISWGLYLQGQSAQATNYEILTKYEKIKSIKDEIEVLKGAYVETVKNQNATEYATELQDENTASTKANTKANEDKEKSLTGLAKLQKELGDLEKKRSDYLVKTGGVMDTQFYQYTEQVIALEESIDSLQSKLKERGITFQEARKIEGVDENGNILLPKPKDTLATDNKDEKAEKEKAAEEEKKRIEDLKHLSQSFTDITLWLTEQRIEALERENAVQQRIYDESKTRENEIIELRKAGALNTAESLAFEREAQAKALKEQEKIAKKKQRLELLNTSLNMFNSAVQSGNGDPLGKTIGDVTALVGFIKSIPLFWKGTDATVGDTLGTKFSNGRDGILARVDASEMILNKGKVDALKGMGITTTDGILEAIEMRRYTATPTSVNPIMFDNSEVVNRLEKHERLLQKIANRPYEVSDIEKIANTIKITQQIMTNNKTVTTTKNIRTR